MFPFQFSAVMTNDRWCGLNVGFSNGVAEIVDMSLIWSMQHYFGHYFIHSLYDYPGFAYEKLEREYFLPSPTTFSRIF